MQTIDRHNIEIAHSFFHQKLRVYEFSTSETQRDDIEYAISDYVSMMSEELFGVISGGRSSFLKEHGTFESDLRTAIQRMSSMLGQQD